MREMPICFLFGFVESILCSEELLAQRINRAQSFIDTISHVRTARESEATQLPRYINLSTDVMVLPPLRVALDLSSSCAEHPFARMNKATVLEDLPLLPTCIASPKSFNVACSSSAICFYLFLTNDGTLLLPGRTTKPVDLLLRRQLSGLAAGILK